MTAQLDINIDGGAAVQSAEYSLNDSITWTLMSAAVGTGFNFSASFTAAQMGANKVCVRGTDTSAVVTDPPVCALFDVIDKTPPLVSAVAVTPDPLYLNAAATVTALVDDTTTGGSAIKSAEYSLNGGAFTKMDASDGVFNGVSEAVTASFTADKIGDNQVCVRGIDALDNASTGVCATFTVQYVFSGFYSPLRMGAGVVNNAKGGQAIPVKWKLTDANGKLIKDVKSFKAVKSFPVNCGTGVQSGPVVTEAAPGKSGLKYSNGTWQYNWKTSKKYIKSCRSMFVLFKGDTKSPMVQVNFK